MKGRRLTSTGGGVTLHNPPTRGYARALGLRKGFFMLPSGVQPQPPRDSPSEAAYGSSGRPRKVGAILRCVLTSFAIAACPEPLSGANMRPRRSSETEKCAGADAASETLQNASMFSIGVTDILRNRATPS
jgi:hypothetical protein